MFVNFLAFTALSVLWILPSGAFRPPVRPFLPCKRHNSHEAGRYVKEAITISHTAQGHDRTDQVVLGKQLEGAAAKDFGELSGVVRRPVGRLVPFIYGRQLCGGHYGYPSVLQLDVHAMVACQEA